MPRFHITWGTGPAIVDVFARRLVNHPKVRFAHRHRVDELIVEDGAVTGVRGAVLEPTSVARGVASSRTTVGDFEFRAQAVIVASGGIGGNHDLVRKNWPTRMGRVPGQLLSGVPEHVDGRMLGISETAGAHLINADRMWHYTEGITNYDPIWPMHGIRILPGPSSLWLDATGRRLPAPLYPGFDTLGTLEYIAKTGYDYTWFVLNARIIAKEFGLSGQEQNPDLTGRSVRQVLSRVKPGRPGTGAALRRPRRRLRQRRLVAGLGRQDERGAGRRTAGLRRRRGRGHRPRPRGGQQVHQGQADYRDPRGAQLPRRPNQLASSHRTGSPTRRRAR